MESVTAVRPSLALTNIKSIEYKQVNASYAEMAKNGYFWPKMKKNCQKLWNKWNKLLPDHPYTIPKDFTIEYKQVYAENLLKSCTVEMAIYGHFWQFFGT